MRGYFMRRYDDDCGGSRITRQALVVARADPAGTGETVVVPLVPSSVGGFADH